MKPLKLWCVVNNNHPARVEPYQIWTTLSYYKKDSIKKFIEGSGQSWNHWYSKYNFRCVKVEVTIKEIK